VRTLASSAKQKLPSSESAGLNQLLTNLCTLAKEKAEAQFETLIAALDSIGLRTEARDGANGSVLVFVTVRSEQKLIGEAYRSR